MARRSYTAEQKQAALDVYAEHGPSEASRRTGIPAKTITAWATRGGAADARQKTQRASVEAAKLTWEQRRTELIVNLGEFADRIIAATARVELPDTIEPRDLQALLTAVGIAVDKAQLLSGGATSRGEVVSTDERRQRVEQLQADLERRGVLRSVG